MPLPDAVSMKLLSLSNGHGEDGIAVRVLEALRQQSNAPDIAALPLVGEGHAYRHRTIPLIGAVKPMPSGGFIYMDNRQLARDIRGGLVQLTLAQLGAIRQWAKATRGNGFILAVGDIVPLLFAWGSGLPYAFIGTAKSEYHIRDEAGWLPRSSWWDDRLERSTGCVYLPWERWLMTRPQCKAVFPRDGITARILQRFRVPAVDLGNPMMDGLEIKADHQGDVLTIVLLPGSRVPEAHQNWQLILRAVGALVDAFKQPLRFLGAIAPGIQMEELEKSLVHHGWEPAAFPPSSDISPSFTRKQAVLELSHLGFADYLHQADLGIALAGTATEQLVGLGKPVITIPGQGPQFTPAFAEAQRRLLGPSVVLLDRPEQIVSATKNLLENPDALQLIAENGVRRMGEPGSAQRIAGYLLQYLLQSCQ